MPAPKGSQIPADSLLQLRQRLEQLPGKSRQRAHQIAAVAELYGVSTTTVYRALQRLHRPHAAHRADRGKPRVLPAAELQRYCELVAALKLPGAGLVGLALPAGASITQLVFFGVGPTSFMLVPTVHISNI